MNRKTHVLLAEDNSDHQRLLKRALSAAAAEVVVSLADSREAVLEACRGHPPDCVVLDFNLAGCAAPAIIADIRPLIEDVPIIVVSQSDEQRVVIESLRTGVADFIPKQSAVEGDALWRAIDAAVRARRRSRYRMRRSNRRMQIMRREAETDFLTELANRRAALRVLASPRTRSDRRESASVVMFDIDNFKAINDRYGHASGDSVLRAVAQTLRQESRDGDLLARWGGEEFLAVRWSSDLIDAWAWADRVRERVCNDRRVLNGCELRVTVSGGVCTVPTPQVGEETLRHADRALYAAKDYGRNRVLTWPMAHALEAAEQLGDAGGADLEGRVQLLLSRLSDIVGPIHIEHAQHHGRNVARVANHLGRALGMSGERLAELSDAARFHDLGKIGIPDEILARPGRLRPDERRFVDTHAQFGADLLRIIGAMPRVVGLVRCHHSRFDARALAEVKCDPVALGLVGVADAASAMMSNRPYAAQRSFSQVLAELDRGCGHQFDPVAVDTFRCAGQCGCAIAA